MKAHLLALFCFVICSVVAQPELMVPATPASSTSLPVVENKAFQVGEYLKYRIHYGIINAGIAELQVSETTTRNQRKVYHMIGTGRSVGMAEWFFRTRDRYESFIDTEAMLPWEFIRDVDEGGYVIKRHLKFDHYNQMAVETLKDPDQSYPIIQYAQDMLSAFYYARCIKTEELEPGDELPVDMFLDYEDFSFKLKFLGYDVIKTRWGKVRCKKLIPVVQEGRVFSDKEGLTLWVTDDENKIPVRLEAELVVGSIKMDLVEYKNLIRPISFQD
jgi:hypothetical protein